MPQIPRECRKCGDSYILHPKKPGLVFHCPNCSEETATPLVAKVAYPSKNSSLVEIEITSDVRAAHLFNSCQKRRGGGSPLSSIIQGRESGAGREAGKQGSGAESYATYNSNLGEKRKVKL